jgi:hypothetical protein
MWDRLPLVGSVDSGKLYTNPDPNTGVVQVERLHFGLQAEAMW